MVVRHLFPKGIRMIASVQKRKTDLEVTVDNTLDYLRRRNYPSETLARYRKHFKDLIRYAKAHHQPRLTESLLDKFKKCRTKDYMRYSREVKANRCHRREWLNTAMRVLWEFHRTGTHRLTSAKSRIPLAPYFERELSNLDLYCHEELGWSQDSRYGYSNVWRRFLEFVGQWRKLRNWNSLRLGDFSRYIQSGAKLARRTQVIRIAYLRALTKIVFVLGRLRHPLHELLPQASKVGRNPPPQLWSRSDYEKTLADINRSTGLGLRDYAILLIAGRLGLRSGDIKFLRIDSLLWDERIIELTQRKNGKMIRLPLLPDVGDAIADYLRNGRPPSEAPEIFIRHSAPWGPLRHLSEIATRHQLRAGITPIHHRSVHALRHTLATGLLTDGVPLPAIAASLGHRQMETTRRYLPVATELMRQAALEVEWKEADHDQ
jgi:integrase